MKVIQSIFSGISRSRKLISTQLQEPIVSNFLNISTLTTIVLLSLAVTAIAFIFEPFGMSDYAGSNKLLLQIEQGVATFLGLAFSLFILPLIFKNYFNSQNWNIGRSILTEIQALFFGLLFLMVFSNQTGIASFSLPSLLITTTILGAIVLVITYIFRVPYLIKKHLNKAELLSQQYAKMPLIENKNSLFPVLKFSDVNNSLSLLPNQLIMVDTSIANVKLAYQNMFGVAFQEISLSPSKVEEELNHFEQFIRISRHVSVNKNAIVKAVGNAEGVQLLLGKVDQKLKVDKHYLDSL